MRVQLAVLHWIALNYRYAEIEPAVTLRAWGTFSGKDDHMGEFNPPADVLRSGHKRSGETLVMGVKEGSSMGEKERADCVLKAQQLVGALGTGSA